MNYNDQFDEPPRAGFLANIGPKAAFFIVLIALSFMIGVVWKLYTGAGSNAPQNVPIVRADSDPFKVIPDDPGGMEIRHKDSTLFSAIKKERNEEPKIENLLADDTNEEPMPRSQLFAGLNTDADTNIIRNDAPTPLDQPVSADQKTMTAEQVEEVEELIEETNQSVVPPAPPAPEPEAMPEKKVDAVSETKAEIKEAKPAPKPAVKVKPTPAPTPAPAPVEMRTESMPVASDKKPSGGYYVQLASTKDKASAENEWKKLAKKYSISSLPHRVETADLGAKGVYYRIQAGPFSRDVAQSKCAAIKKINPTGCLVKK